MATRIMNGIVPGRRFLGVYLFGFGEIISGFYWKYFHFTWIRKCFLHILMKVLSLWKFFGDKKHERSILKIFQCLLKFWHIQLLASENLYLLQLLMNEENLLRFKGKFSPTSAELLWSQMCCSDLLKLRDLASSSSPYNPILTEIVY